jgi:hypothetical protein
LKHEVVPQVVLGLDGVLCEGLPVGFSLKFRLVVFIHRNKGHKSKSHQNVDET